MAQPAPESTAVREQVAVPVREQAEAEEVLSLQVAAEAVVVRLAC